MCSTHDNILTHNIFINLAERKLHTFVLTLDLNRSILILLGIWLKKPSERHFVQILEGISQITNSHKGLCFLFASLLRLLTDQDSHPSRL